MKHLGLALLLAPLFCSASPAAAETLDDLRFLQWGRRELTYANRRPYFLSRDQLLSLPIAPPPANSAPATQRELDELRRLQSVRTEQQEKTIAQHRQFSGVCDAFFALLRQRAATHPRTLALLEHVDVDVTIAAFSAKRRFNRARPSQLAPCLNPSLPVPAHAAYPSGHALQGHVVARVLGLLVPESGVALRALGEEIGHEREIAGLHYASDSAASRALGDALFSELEKNPHFLSELESARREWSASAHSTK
jgi:acid phosphatase (class A)